MTPRAAITLPVTAGNGTASTRTLPQETPVALVYNGTTLAVMMATPADLTDFAHGFTLSEGLATAAELGAVEVKEHPNGIEARQWLPETRAKAMAQRRRTMAGPVGCGLCGIDSLDQAARDVPRVGPGVAISVTEIGAALDGLRSAQPLHDETRAVHAAGLWTGQMDLVREDVGRHNALDKLIGAMARQGAIPTTLVLTARISIDMVQKSAMAGFCTIISVSAPTAAGVQLAETAGITLVTQNRHGTQVFTHPLRILAGEPQ